MKNNKGFTLIEIIAVLILIGILAAVAVTKFFNLANTTEQKSLQVALVDMKSRALIAHSKSMINNNGNADPDEQKDYSNLGLATQDDIENAYTDFAGELTRTSGTVITYTPKNFTSATFTLTKPVDEKAPAKIELSITD